MISKYAKRLKRIQNNYISQKYYSNKGDAKYLQHAILSQIVQFCSGPNVLP